MVTFGINFKFLNALEVLHDLNLPQTIFLLPASHFLSFSNTVFSGSSKRKKRLVRLPQVSLAAHGISCCGARTLQWWQAGPRAHRLSSCGTKS